jgi:amicyanin
MLLNKFMTLGISTARKQLKPALFCLVALSALVLLAACGGSSTNTGTGTTPTTGTTSTPAATPTTGTTSTTAATPTTGTTSTPTATATQAGNAQTVMIISSGSFAFSPATLTIKVGTTVIWKNTTAAPHTVTSDDGKTFDSGMANPIAAQGGTFSFTFTSAGTFAYHCSIHPFMKATIIVQ